MAEKTYHRNVQSKQDYFERNNLFQTLREECGAKFVDRVDTRIQEKLFYHLFNPSLTVVYAITAQKPPYNQFHSGHATLRVIGTEENIGEFERLLEAAEKEFKKSPNAQPSAPDGF